MTASAPGNRPVKPVRTLVYLARHSQTPLNESDVLRGLTDPPLDDAGQRRASQLGATLGSRKPSVVVASPLRRALQTAQPVADRDQRAVPGLTDAAERYRGCAVSHDAVTRQVLMAFDLGLDDPDALPQDNQCFNALELCEGGWTVR